MTAATSPYVAAVRAGDLFADGSYQRDVDPRRIRKMATEFDSRLLGVLEVSARDDSRFAILDGQHRHALVLDVHDGDAMLVCQVYEGLTVQQEAELFHELNARRKALSFWDKWKSRRSAGDEQVAAIERTLASHGLQVHPAADDGNIGATAALETIVTELGDLYLLDSVIVILLAAFGRTRDAFEGAVMQGMANVLASYHSDELDRDRLVGQLRDLPVRQLRARALGLRELHRGTLPRLCAAVIVEQYNRGRGPRVQPFLERVPTAASNRPARPAAPPTPAPVPAPVATPVAAADAVLDCGRCGHLRARHSGELAPQCEAASCTCLRFVGPPR